MRNGSAVRAASRKGNRSRDKKDEPAAVLSFVLQSFGVLPRAQLCALAGDRRSPLQKQCGGHSIRRPGKRTQNIQENQKQGQKNPLSEIFF